MEKRAAGDINDALIFKRFETFTIFSIIHFNTPNAD